MMDNPRDIWKVAALSPRVSNLPFLATISFVYVQEKDSHVSSIDGLSFISDGHTLICSVLVSALKKTPALINEVPPSPMI
jgi:hypothetical protein